MAKFTLEAEIKISRGKVQAELNEFIKQVKESAKSARAILSQALDPTEFIQKGTAKIRTANAVPTSIKLPTYLQQATGVEKTDSLEKTIAQTVKEAFTPQGPTQTSAKFPSFKPLTDGFKLVKEEAEKAAAALRKLTEAALSSVQKTETQPTTAITRPPIGFATGPAPQAPTSILPVTYGQGPNAPPPSSQSPQIVSHSFTANEEADKAIKDLEASTEATNKQQNRLSSARKKSAKQTADTATQIANEEQKATEEAVKSVNAQATSIQQQINKEVAATNRAVRIFQNSRGKIEGNIGLQQTIPASVIVQNFQQREIAQVAQSKLPATAAGVDLRPVQFQLENVREYRKLLDQQRAVLQQASLAGGTSFRSVEVLESERQRVATLFAAHPELGSFDLKPTQVELGHIKEYQSLIREGDQLINGILTTGRSGFEEKIRLFQQRQLSLNQAFRNSGLVIGSSGGFGGGGGTPSSGGGLIALPPHGGANYSGGNNLPVPVAPRGGGFGGGNVPPGGGSGGYGNFGFTPQTPGVISNINNGLSTLIHNFGRIAVFSIVAGLVVRGFYELQNAIAGSVTGAIKFNSALEQQRLAIAGVLAITRQVTDANKQVVSPLTTFPIFLAEAAKQQRELLFASVKTLGSQEELQQTFERILALSGHQKGTDQDRLTVATSLVNAGHLLGLTGERLFDETRQLFQLDSKRGQLIALILGLDIKELRNIRDKGELLKLYTERLGVFNVLAETAGQTMQGLLTSVSSLGKVASADTFKTIFIGLQEVLKGARDELTKQTSGETSINVALGVSPESLRATGQIIAQFFIEANKEAAKFFGFIAREIGDGKAFSQGLLVATKVVFGAIESLIIVVEALFTFLKRVYEFTYLIVSTLGKAVSVVLTPFTVFRDLLSDIYEIVKHPISFLTGDLFNTKKIDDAEKKLKSFKSFVDGSIKITSGALTGAAVGAFVGAAPIGAVIGAGAGYVAHVRQQEAEEGYVENEKRILASIASARKAVQQVLGEANTGINRSDPAKFAKDLSDALQQVAKSTSEVNLLASNDESLAKYSQEVDSLRKAAVDAAHGVYDFSGSFEETPEKIDAARLAISELNKEISALNVDIAKKIAEQTLNAGAIVKSDLENITAKGQYKKDQLDKAGTLTPEAGVKIDVTSQLETTKYYQQQIEEIDKFSKKELSVAQQRISSEEKVTLAQINASRVRNQDYENFYQLELSRLQTEDGSYGQQIEVIKKIGYAQRLSAQASLDSEKVKKQAIVDNISALEEEAKKSEEAASKTIQSLKGVQFTDPNLQAQQDRAVAAAEQVAELNRKQNQQAIAEKKAELQEAEQAIASAGGGQTGFFARIFGQASDAITNISEKTNQEIERLKVTLKRLIEDLTTDIEKTSLNIAKTVAQQTFNGIAELKASLNEINLDTEKKKRDLTRSGQLTPEVAAKIDTQADQERLKLFQQETQEIDSLIQKEAEYANQRIENENRVAEASISARRILAQADAERLRAVFERQREENVGLDAELQTIRAITAAERAAAQAQIDSDSAQLKSLYQKIFLETEAAKVQKEDFSKTVTLQQENRPQLGFLGKIFGDSETEAKIKQSDEVLRGLYQQQQITEDTHQRAIDGLKAEATQVTATTQVHVGELKKIGDEGEAQALRLKQAFEQVIIDLNREIVDIGKDIAKTFADQALDSTAAIQENLDSIHENRVRKEASLRKAGNFDPTTGVPTLDKEENLEIQRFLQTQTNAIEQTSRKRLGINEEIISSEQHVKAAQLGATDEVLKAKEQAAQNELENLQLQNASYDKQAGALRNLGGIKQQIQQNAVAQSQAELVATEKTNTTLKNSYQDLQQTLKENRQRIEALPEGTPEERKSKSKSLAGAQIDADRDLKAREREIALSDAEIPRIKAKIAAQQAGVALIGDETSRQTTRLSRELQQVVLDIQNQIANVGLTVAQTAAAQLSDVGGIFAAELDKITAEAEKEKARLLKDNKGSTEAYRQIDIRTSFERLHTDQGAVDDATRFTRRDLSIQKEEIKAVQDTVNAHIEARKSITESNQAFLEQELSRVQEQEGGYQKEIDLIYKIGEAQKEAGQEQVDVLNAQLEARQKLVDVEEKQYQTDVEGRQKALEDARADLERLKGLGATPEKIEKADTAVQGIERQIELQTELHNLTLEQHKAEIESDAAKRDAAIKNIDLITKKIEQEADRIRIIKVPVGDIFANTVGNAIDQAEQGTLNFKKIWKGFTTDLHTAFSDAFKEMLKRKLHFDVIFKDNVLDLSKTFSGVFGDASQKAGDSINSFGETVAQVAQKASDFFKVERENSQQPLAKYEAPKDVKEVVWKIVGQPNGAGQEEQKSLADIIRGLRDSVTNVLGGPTSILGGTFHGITEAVFSLLGINKQDKLKETGNVPLDHLHVAQAQLKVLQEIKDGGTDKGNTSNTSSLNNITNILPDAISGISDWFKAGTAGRSNPFSTYDITSSTNISGVIWKAVGSAVQQFSGGNNSGGILSGTINNVLSAVTQYSKEKSSGNVLVDQLNVQKDIRNLLKNGFSGGTTQAGVPNVDISQLGNLLSKLPSFLQDLDTINFFHAGTVGQTNPLRNYDITSATDLSKVTWNVVGPVDVNAGLKDAFPDLGTDILKVINDGCFGSNGGKSTLDAIQTTIGNCFGGNGASAIQGIPGLTDTTGIANLSSNASTAGPVEVTLSDQSEGFFSTLWKGISGAFSGISSGAGSIFSGIGSILGGSSAGGGGGLISSITSIFSRLFSGGSASPFGATGGGDNGGLSGAISLLTSLLGGQNGSGGLSGLLKSFSGGGIGNILGIINAVGGKGNSTQRGISGGLNAAAFIPGPQQPFVAIAAKLFDLFAPFLFKIGRIEAEKETLDKYFSKVFGEKYKVVSEKQGASGLRSIGPTSTEALTALGTQYASTTKGSNQGTIVRFGAQFAGNLEKIGVSGAGARDAILKLAQTMNFDLDSGLTAINKNIQTGLFSMKEFDTELGDARKNLSKYGDTSKLSAKELSDLALANGNTGSFIVTLNKALAGTIGLVTQFNPLIDDAVLANNILGDEFGKTAKSTGLFNDQVANIEKEIDNGNLSIEEAVKQLNELRKAADLKPLDLKAFQLDPGAIKIQLDTITTITQSLHDGVKQAIIDGVQAGTSATDISKNLKRTLFQSIFDTVVNGFVDGFIKATTTTGPLTAALARVGKLIADFASGSISKEDFYSGIGDSFKNLEPIIKAISDATGIAADEFKKILESAGVLPDILNDAANNAQALVKAARDLLFDQNLSPLTSRQRLAGQQQDFLDLRKKALGGDQQAIQDLPAAAQAYLENARKIFASSTDYEKAFDFVRSTLLEVAKANGAVSDIPLDQLNTLKEIRDLIKAQGPIENTIPPPSNSRLNPSPTPPGNNNPANPGSPNVLSGPLAAEMIDLLKLINIHTSDSASNLLIFRYDSVLGQIKANLDSINVGVGELVSIGALAASSAVAQLSNTDINTPVPKKTIATPFGTVRVPGLREGGVVTQKEALALLHGPEAVIPLSSSNTINFTSPAITSTLQETNNTIERTSAQNSSILRDATKNSSPFSSVSTRQPYGNDEIIPGGTKHGDDWVNKLTEQIKDINLQANVNVNINSIPSNNNQNQKSQTSQQDQTNINLVDQHGDAFKPIDISDIAAKGGRWHGFITPDLPHGNYGGYGPLKGFTKGYAKGGLITAKEERAILHGPELVIPLEKSGDHTGLEKNIPLLSRVLSEGKVTQDNRHLSTHATCNDKSLLPSLQSSPKILGFKDGGIVTDKETQAFLHGPEIIVPLRPGYQSNPFIQKGIPFLTEALSSVEKTKQLTTQFDHINSVHSIQEEKDNVSVTEFVKSLTDTEILKKDVPQFPLFTTPLDRERSLPSFKEGGLVTAKETKALIHGPELIVPLKAGYSERTIKDAIPQLTNIFSGRSVTHDASTEHNTHNATHNAFADILNSHQQIQKTIQSSANYMSAPQVASSQASYNTFNSPVAEYRKSLPSFRDGGIVNAPQITANLHGPEAIIPLPHGGDNRLQVTSPEMISMMGRMVHALENNQGLVAEVNIDGNVQLGESKLGKFIVKTVQSNLKNRQIRVPKNALTDQEF